MTALALRGVTVSFNGTTVVDDVSLRVDPGRWVGIIGPNGAGKSSILNAVAGTVPHAGSIEVGGVDVRSLSRRARAKQVAMVPQHPSIPQGIAVFDYVLLGRTPHIGYFGSESAVDLAVTEHVIGSLGLKSFESRAMDSLSGGELQRAVIARALAQQAPILLLDEPTTALDIGRQQDVLELIDGLRGEGLTVVSAMHDLTIAGQFVDELTLVDGGAVVASGSPAEVLRPDLIARHYRAEVDVVDGDGGLVVVPRRRTAQPTWEPNKAPMP